MKRAIEIFVSLFILVITVALCMGIISADLAVMEARDCYYSCVNELKESNFADSVTLSCITNANNNGYSLYIDVLESLDGDRSASVTLKYTYKIPALGISQEKTIEGLVD